MTSLGGGPSLPPLAPQSTTARASSPVLSRTTEDFMTTAAPDTDMKAGWQAAPSAWQMSQHRSIQTLASHGFDAYSNPHEPWESSVDMSSPPLTPSCHSDALAVAGDDKAIYSKSTSQGISSRPPRAVSIQSGSNNVAPRSKSTISLKKAPTKAKRGAAKVADRRKDTSKSQLVTPLDAKYSVLDMRNKSRSTLQRDGRHVIPPLTANNFFFRFERERIVRRDNSIVSASESGSGRGSDSNGSIDEADGIDSYAEILQNPRPFSEQALLDQWSRDPRVKRKHTRSHGRISFASLTQRVVHRWRTDPELVKNIFQQIAAQYFERYTQETRMSVASRQHQRGAVRGRFVWISLESLHAISPVGREGKSTGSWAKAEQRLVHKRTIP